MDNSNDIKQPQNIVCTKPRLMNDNHMHYCPGCSHGVVHRLIAEIIEEMGAENITIGIAPVGCAVFAYNYIDIDWIEATHGRAPAVATAAKRLNPTGWCSHTRATATLPLSARQRQSMPLTVAKTSQ